MLKCVIFDLDGVLTDTSRFHYLCWKRIAEENGVPYKKEYIERFKGVSRKECAKILFPNEKNEEEIEKLANLKNDYYLEMCKTLTPKNLYSGAKKLLEQLRENNVMTALGSASKNTDLVLSQLGIKEMFDTIVSGNDIINSKPAPDLFLLAADRLGLKPKECIVVEDAFAGIQAAHAAGMIGYGIGDREGLPNADMLSEKIGEVSLDKLKDLYDSKILA